METAQYKRKSTKIILVLIALFPVAAHIVLLLLSSSIRKIDYITFGKLDVAVSIIVLIYLLGGILALNNKKWMIRLILVIYSLLFTIIGAEAAFQFLYPGTNIPLLPMRIEYDPIIHFLPGINGKVKFSVNRYGLRGPDIDLDKPDIKILTLGGSAVECFYVTDKLSWPWRLQDILSERLKKNVFVGNAGRCGYLTPHCSFLLRNYKWAHRFDWVILLSGVNDMGTLLHDNYDERVKRVPAETFIKSNIIEKNGLPYYRNLMLYKKLKYNLSDTTVIQDFYGLWVDKARQTRRSALKTHAISQMPAKLSESLHVYKANLQNLINICRERNHNLLMLTQPTMWKKNLSPELENLLLEYVDENRAYTTETLERIINIYNAITIDVCKKEGIPYIDLSLLLSKDISTFYDDCHFNISGCEKIAKILADFFISTTSLKEKETGVHDTIE